MCGNNSYTLRVLVFMLSVLWFCVLTQGTEQVGIDEISDNSTREEAGVISKYVSPSTDIVLEHVDFVSLRLLHVMNQTSSNLTDLLQIQQEEFSTNSIYKSGWEAAAEIFNTSIRARLQLEYGNESSILVDVPEEYHIALIAYTMQWPSVYTDFNEKTRQLCSHQDILAFKYKSYFKLLELAIQLLGKKLHPGTNRFLYRGVGKNFALKESQQVAFQHFISTSIQQSVAEMFSSGSSLFEFDDGPKSSLGIYLGSHSVFPGEEEVLLSPLQVFQVDSIHTGNYYTRYVLKAKVPTTDDRDKCRDCKLSSENVSVGKLLTTVSILASVLGVICILVVVAGIIAGCMTVKRTWGIMSNNPRTESVLQLT